MRFPSLCLLHELDLQRVNAVEMPAVRRRTASAGLRALQKQRLEPRTFGHQHGVGEQGGVSQVGQLIVRMEVAAIRQALRFESEGGDPCEMLLFHPSRSFAQLQSAAADSSRLRRSDVSLA